MTCESFRSRIREGEETPEILAHLRNCPGCLEAAVDADPDSLFRSIGGSDLVPPGGVDLFVGEVMQQIHVRSAETRLASGPRMPAVWRWAAAAAVTIGLVSLGVVNRPVRDDASQPVQAAAVKRAAPSQIALVSRPVVESYDSPNATIVEVPTDQNDDNVKIVMVFDESLPADL